MGAGHAALEFRVDGFDVRTVAQADPRQNDAGRVNRAERAADGVLVGVVFQPCHLMRDPPRRVGIVGVAAHDDLAARVGHSHVQAGRNAASGPIDDADA